MLVYVDDPSDFYQHIIYIYSTFVIYDYICMHIESHNCLRYIYMYKYVCSHMYIYIYADVELYSYQYVSISIFFHIICLPMSLVPPASGCEPSDKIEMRACNTQSCCWAVVCSQNRCGLGLVGRMIVVFAAG